MNNPNIRQEQELAVQRLAPVMASARPLEEGEYRLYLLNQSCEVVAAAGAAGKEEAVALAVAVVDAINCEGTLKENRIDRGEGALAGTLFPIEIFLYEGDSAGDYTYYLCVKHHSGADQGERVWEVVPPAADQNTTRGDDTRRIALD